MRGDVAGVIAGVVGGVINVVFGMIGIMIGFIQYIPDVSVIALISREIILNAIWGAILGALYEFFYSAIPGNGIKKGLIFSLLIFFLGGVRIASLLQIYHMFEIGAIIIWLGFFNSVTQGVVLGALYKK